LNSKSCYFKLSIMNNSNIYTQCLVTKSKAIALVLLAFFALSVPTSAQFNVRIGYSLGFVSPETNNSIIQLHNTQRAMFFDQYTPAEDLNLMYGISLGLRYKLDLGSLELHWESISRTLASTGRTRPEPPLPTTSLTQEIQYSLNMLMLTYETNFNRIGIGSSIGKNFLGIKEILSNSKDKPSFLDNDSGQDSNHFIARFHIAFNFYGNSTVAFAIKPFIQFAVTNSDLTPLADNLGVSTNNTKEGFPMWGLSFAFYNGRQ